GECGRQPGKGVGSEPSGLMGDDRTPVQLARKVELLGEKFCRRFDRAVSHKRVGRGGLAQVPRNQSSEKLNEHGPALNVFWSRLSGMGAGVDRKKDKDKDGEACR